MLFFFYEKNESPNMNFDFILESDFASVSLMESKSGGILIACKIAYTEENWLWGFQGICRILIKHLLVKLAAGYSFHIDI